MLGGVPVDDVKGAAGIDAVTVTVLALTVLEAEGGPVYCQCRSSSLLHYARTLLTGQQGRHLSAQSTSRQGMERGRDR